MDEKPSEPHVEEEGIDDDAAKGEAQTDEARLREENQFYVDQLQRARAELDNLRRRTIKERATERVRITMDVFRGVLPIFDDLGMALRAGDTGDAGKLEEGLRIIADKFTRVLEEFGVRPIEAVGEPFDPEWHEAVFQEETTEVPCGHVMEEFERGYRLGDALLRPARVKVAKAPAEESSSVMEDDQSD